MDAIVDWLMMAKSQYAWAAYLYLGLGGLGSLVTSGRTYIKKSATKKDDEWLSSLEAKSVPKWILSFLEKFSWVKEK